VVPAGEALVQVIFADGRRLAAQVQRRDEWLDLAVLKAVGARAPALAMGDASALGAGDKVVMIGSPRGLDFTVHEGSVSHAGRNSYGLAYIQIDANVNPGNSGGPLLDEQGRVVGVVSMMVGRSSGLGMVLPINYAYDGEGALIPPPRPGPDLAAWRGLLAQVAEADRKEVAEIAEGFVDAPGLVDAVRFGSDGVSGIAIRRFARGHSPGTFSNLYQMSQEGRFVCSLPCAFEEWRSMETLAEERSGDSRFFRWLKRNRLTEDLWVGHAPVSSLSQQCPALDPRRPFEIVLGQADPRADRVVVDLGRSGDEGR
jgi:serine protease Do